MIDPAEQPRVEFTLTVDDYLAWHAFALRHDGSLRAQWEQGGRTTRGLFWWCVVGAVLLALLEYTHWERYGHVSWVSVCVLVGVVACAAFAARSLRDREGGYLVTMRKIVESDGGPIRSPQVLLVGDEALINTSENGRWEYTWSHGVESMAIGPQHVFIYVVAGCYIVPMRAFPQERAQQEFVNAVRGRMAASGGPASARNLREHLKDKDVPCPECRYSLRGLTHARCPECGLQITLESITARKT